VREVLKVKNQKTAVKKRNQYQLSKKHKAGKEDRHKTHIALPSARNQYQLSKKHKAGKEDRHKIHIALPSARNIAVFKLHYHQIPHLYFQARLLIISTCALSRQETY